MTDEQFMAGFSCDQCDLKWPHHHGTVGNGVNSAPATIYHSKDPRREVRDSETGEVIFPAVKGPLRVIEGGKP